MRTIYKYPVKRQGPFELTLPANAQIVRFADQDGVLFIWAIVDTDQPPAVRYFQVIGTGHEIGFEYNKHIGTCEQAWFIWHLFENTIPACEQL